MAFLAPIIGGALGLAGSLFGGDDKQQDVTSTTAPWGPQQPYLQDLFKYAQELYGGTGRQVTGTKEIPGVKNPNYNASTTGTNWYDPSYPEAGGAQRGSVNTWDEWLTPPTTENVYGEATQGGADKYIPRPTAGYTDVQRQAMNLIQQKASQADPMNTALSTFITGLAGGQNNITAPTINPASAIASSSNPASFNAAQIGKVNMGGPVSMAPVGDVNAANIDFRYYPGLDKMARGSMEDPYVKQMVAAAILPMQENYLNTIVPGMNAEAQKAGKFGGSSNDLLRAQAASNLTRDVGNTSANLYGTTYENAQNRAMQAMGLGGQLATSQAQLQQQAALANQQADIAESQGNANLAEAYRSQAASLNAQIATANAGFQQQAGLTNAGFQQQAGMANADRAQQVSLANAGFGQQANILNAGNQMTAQQNNIGNILSAINPALNLQNMDFSNLQRLFNVGELDRTINQAGLNEIANKAAFEQQAPWDNLTRLANLIKGQYGTTTTTPSFQPSAASQLVGGAATGAGLNKAFGDPVGQLLNYFGSSSGQSSGTSSMDNMSPEELMAIYGYGG